MSDKQYRFILKPYKTPSDKETCPSCEHRRKYKRYIDTHTGELLPEQYGRCDREDNCGYHLSPYSDGYSKMIYEQERGNKSDWKPYKPPLAKPQPKPISFIPLATLEKTLGHYENNYFIKFLRTRFDEEVVKRVLDLYLIGTSKVWPGACIFWQIDLKARVRTGKIMLYSQLTGKRIKEPYNHITWVHKKIDSSDTFNLSHCLFGEHLVNLEPDKTILVVESEKTAIIGSIYFPEYIWLATGGKEGLNDACLHALVGRKVILCPDLSRQGKAFSDWAEIAQRNANLLRYTVSDYLEKRASREQREQGLDLADYLLELDYLECQQQQEQALELPQPDHEQDSQKQEPTPLSAGVHTVTNWKGTIYELEINEDGYPALFDTLQQEQALLDRLIADLDNGKPWELIYRHHRGHLPYTITADTLPAYFYGLGNKYLSVLLVEERRKFIQERFNRGNYTNFGIVEHYPCFGFKSEYQVMKFIEL